VSATPQALDIVIARSADCATVQLAGDLDLASADAVVAAVEDLLGEAGTGMEVVVDLAGVGFCDSAGINALVRVRKLATGRDASLRLANPQPAVRRTLDITGMSAHLGLA
jgi:anti-sigma B factor antagonist